MKRDNIKNLFLNHFYAFLFATILTVIHLSQYFFFSISDFKVNEKSPLNLVMSPYSGFKIPVEGESITTRTFWIKAGETLTPAKEESLKLFFKPTFPLIDFIITIFLIYSLFLFFFYYIENRAYIPFYKKFTFFGIIFLVSFYAKLTASYIDISLFYLPFIPLAGLCLIFFQKRVTTAIVVLISFLVSIYYHYSPFIFFSMLISTGFSMIFFKKDNREVTFLIPVFFGTAIVIFIHSVFNLTSNQTVLNSDFYAIVWSLLSVPIIYLVILLLKLYTAIFPKYDIMSYLNLDHPLLKQLQEKAPGTYQHSLAMANLAETAATAIEADGLLCRVGAYYHDIGKMFHPEYYIENQQGENPHNFLEPEESARMIKLHVTQGLTTAEEYSIPRYISQFIDKHHGSTLLEFFYEKSKENNPDISIDNFRYPGRKPDNKETAILMIVDSVEAASRTLTTPTLQNIENLVVKIIFNKLLYNQLTNSTLTLSELRKIALSLIESIKNNSHSRIEYPWQKEEKNGGKALNSSGRL